MNQQKKWFETKSDAVLSRDPITKRGPGRGGKEYL